MCEKLAMVLGAVLCFPILPGAEEPKEPPVDPARVRAAIERLEKADEAAQRRALADLRALGPQALEEVRRARQSAADERAREKLNAAARWLLAAKLVPVLTERTDSGLTFDGQFSDLRGEGAETADALFELFDDEETPLKVRVAALHALADLGDRALVDRIRRAALDPLLPEILQSEGKLLLAILGDTKQVEKDIQSLASKAERRKGDLDETFRANQDLANMYYRIRQYNKAVECFERLITILEGARREAAGEPGIRRGFDRQLALTYYNAACSLSLNRDIDRAKTLLRKAVGLDITHLKNLEQDGDLRNLREAPGYQEFKRELEKPLEKKSL